jgi:hypothetical protein
VRRGSAAARVPEQLGCASGAHDARVTRV